MDRQAYRGYDLHWTGWKAHPDRLYLVSQWVAMNGEKIIVASWPGLTDTIASLDDYINTARYHPQWNIFEWDSEEEKRMAWAALLESLKCKIDGLMDK